MDSDLPGYPALVSHPPVPPQPQQPRPFIPPLPRRIRKVGAPLGVIIALGTVVDATYRLHSAAELQR